MSSENSESTNSITLDQAFKYVRIIERGLSRLGMRRGDNVDDLRFHECHETMVLYELVSTGGLVELEMLIKRLEKEKVSDDR